MDWLESIDTRNKRQAKYDREHTKGVYLKLNLRTDRDIIQWTWRQQSVQGSIKKLIREDIRSYEGTGKTATGGAGNHEA